MPEASPGGVVRQSMLWRIGERRRLFGDGAFPGNAGSSSASDVELQQLGTWARHRAADGARTEPGVRGDVAHRTAFRLTFGGPARYRARRPSLFRRGSQVVRPRSAKPLFVGSIPTRASIQTKHISGKQKRLATGEQIDLDRSQWRSVGEDAFRSRTKVGRSNRVLAACEYCQVQKRRIQRPTVCLSCRALCNKSRE